ncbi:fibronectin type III domain-containing protein [Eubacteriales bacterium OttesenSCG-928-A19]|nr:fibronectin type III domain-containing protein [Eubacteriales bacterium OttesenSCG-928-A19]
MSIRTKLFAGVLACLLHVSAAYAAELVCPTEERPTLKDAADAALATDIIVIVSDAEHGYADGGAATLPCELRVEAGTLDAEGMTSLTVPGLDIAEGAELTLSDGAVILAGEGSNSGLIEVGHLDAGAQRFTNDGVIRAQSLVSDIVTGGFQNRLTLHANGGSFDGGADTLMLEADAPSAWADAYTLPRAGGPDSPTPPEPGLVLMGWSLRADSTEPEFTGTYNAALSEPRALYAVYGTTTVPGQPTLDIASASPTHVELRWTHPDSGGSAILWYQVYCNGMLYDVVPASETSYVDSRPIPGLGYVYTLVAVNAAGSGVVSNDAVVRKWR